MIQPFNYIRQGFKRFCILSLCTSIFCFPAVDKVYAQGTKEYAVKAAFVFNFTRFIQWPSDSPPNTSESIRLCFIGNHLVADEFNTLDGKTSGTKKISVSRQSPKEDCRNCDIIFFSRDTDPSTVNKILSDKIDKPVLTIGETDDFVKDGGVISFFLKNDRLHFSINPCAADKQGVEISSRLLKLAVIANKNEDCP